jgi:CheY-like chemotaxis protein
MASSSDLEMIAAIVTALGGIGDPASAKPISAHLQSEPPKVMFAAANALGELATAEAIELLDQQLGKRPDLDHAIIDIFAKAQIPEAMSKLNATLISQHAHIRTTGKRKLGEIGTMSVRVLTKNLSQNDSDLVVHSLNVLGDIGDGSAIPAIRKLLHSHPEDANIRFAAYETLGRFDDQKGAFTLAAGLEDPVDNVRSAAAKAIDRNYNGVLAGGIRNLTSAEMDGARKIIETIVDAQCEKIFLDLLEEDYFNPVAMDIITKKVHPEIRAYYVNTLTANGYAQLAGRIALEKSVQEKPRLRVFAVDDSKMMLNIYRTVLHNLGYESMVFEFSCEILEKVENDKPDAVITDLNMPEITGIELTRRLRKWYTKEEMPIIMITTQDEIEATQEVQEAGVNGVLRKPFTESQVRLGLKQYAGLIADP